MIHLIYHIAAICCQVANVLSSSRLKRIRLSKAIVKLATSRLKGLVCGVAPGGKIRTASLRIEIAHESRGAFKNWCHRDRRSHYFS